MTSDNAIVNVPLAKRGNIDNQIDAFKKQQAKIEREKNTAIFHSVRSMKAQVISLLKEMSDARVLTLAKPLGCTKPSTARKALYQTANSNLPLWIKALTKEVNA